MPQTLIPITQRQHEQLQQVFIAVATGNQRLGAMAEAIIAGTDQVLTGRVTVAASQCVDGIYTLVLVTPDSDVPPSASPDSPQ